MNTIRRYLGLKLFLSYFLVILTGAAVLFAASELALPRAFDRHLSMMGNMMGGTMGRPGQATISLYGGFQSAFTEALLLGAFAALIAAIGLSILVTRSVVAPVRAITHASQRIAEGQYSKRVPVTSGSNQTRLDELGQLAHSFNQMASQLEQTEKLRQRLIGDIAHELRTPLTTIKGYMEALLDGVLPADPETYQQVYQEADRLARLVNDLQELSQVEADDFKLDTLPLHVSEFIEPVVAHLDHQYHEKNVTLSVAIPAGLDPVMVNNDRMQQVLLNLLGNALQYTPEGGRVNLTANRHYHELWIEIQDSGIGIPAEHLDHIFDRFYRVDPSRARPAGGSGIGLTIAKQLVEAHSGRIWAASPGPGKGTTFTLALPVANPV